MAIAFDAISAVAAATATSLTFAHTCTGSNRILFVAGNDKVAAATVVTGITYNSVAMTKINGVQIPTSRFITLWDLVAPASGSNNVVVSASESGHLRFVAASYTGAKQSAQPDGNITNTVASPTTALSTTITTTADNCWMVMYINDDNGSVTYTTSTGDSIRLNTDAGGLAFMDTGADITPAGSNTMTMTGVASNKGACSASFSPFVVAATSNPSFILNFV